MEEIEVINIGAEANDGTGDNLRESQIKANTNFSLLRNKFGFDFVNVVLNESDGSEPITQVLIDTINSLQGTNVLILNKSTFISASYAINEVSYNTTWAFREGSGTFGFNNQQISQNNLRSVNTTNQVRLLDPDDLQAVSTISNGINNSNNVLDTNLINVFRRTVLGEVRIFVYNPQEGNQQFIGGNNPDISDADFVDITNQEFDNSDELTETYPSVNLGSNLDLNNHEGLFKFNFTNNNNYSPYEINDFEVGGRVTFEFETENEDDFPLVYGTWNYLLSSNNSPEGTNTITIDDLEYEFEIEGTIQSSIQTFINQQGAVLEDNHDSQISGVDNKLVFYGYAGNIEMENDNQDIVNPVLNSSIPTMLSSDSFEKNSKYLTDMYYDCLLYTSPSPRDS